MARPTLAWASEADIPGEYLVEREGLEPSPLAL